MGEKYHRRVRIFFGPDLFYQGLKKHPKKINNNNNHKKISGRLSVDYPKISEKGVTICASDGKSGPLTIFIKSETVALGLSKR